ncbi:MAG TPA: SDR family NAD(P)-dependent oxidoreductase [Solirubrobacteraceae bacterium]|nr:SDR family NAD(P)-dependent oxidoreductase [Solirubrobacteraceae bacterium]
MSLGGQPRRVVLLGGTSEIGQAILVAMAAAGPLTPVLCGRDLPALEAAGAQLASRGCATAECRRLDADALDTHPEAMEAIFAAGPVDTIVLAVGTLGGQAALDTPRAEALALLQTNFLGAGSLLEAGLQRLRAQGHGRMVVLSSVAAVRPRAGLAYYGAAKAGLDALAQSLGDAALADGVRTLVVRPGFVRTKMTAGLDPAPLATTPEAVAEVTVRALGGRAHTVWAPGAVRWLFMFLSLLPRPLWRRLPG